MSTDQRPVLIGSYALEKHGFTKKELGNDKDTDIDIICKLNHAQQLLWYADKKITPRLFGFSVNSSTSNKDSQLKIIDISLYDDCSDGKMKLYNKCNEQIVNHIPINLNNQLNEYDVLLPPIEWLYALIRGHIHRIPKVTHSQEKNILIWEKYMKKYHAIRSKLGYKTLDDLLQNETDTPYQIFKDEFDYVTRTIGDAPSLEDKPEETFFNDNVIRHIPHDELHLQVSMMNRGVGAKPLYLRFQSNPDSVEMDKSLFMAATKDEQINTIKEEIMVLYLERKALPSAVESDEMLDLFDFKSSTHSDEKTRSTRDFLDIICHFITNLCGSGHSWLRQYCIDHWLLLIDINSYPIEKMCNFVNSFNQAGRLSDELRGEPPTRMSSLQDFVDYHQKVLQLEGNSNEKIEKVLSNHIDIKDKQKRQLFMFEIKKDTKKSKNDWGYGYYENSKMKPFVSGTNGDIWKSYNEYVSFLDGKSYDNHNYDFSSTITLLPSQTKTIVNLWNEFFNIKNNFLVWIDDGTIIYNPSKNIAICMDTDRNQIDLYIIEISHSSGITFGVHKMTLDGNHTFIPPSDALYDTSHINFDIDYKTSSVYESTCNGGYDRDIELQYLNKYGHTFDELTDGFEVLSRILLEFYQDEDEER